MDTDDAPPPRAQISAVVVSYSDPRAAIEAARSLIGQSLTPAEVVIVDNDPSGAVRSEAAREGLLDRVKILEPGRNLGYTRAANLAADAATGEWLFFLNPDARAAPDCLVKLLDAADSPDTAIVGAQVLLPDGRTNAGDNPINVAGLSWSGRYGEPREEGPARDTAAVSGAALMARRDAYLRLGGLCDEFFLYCDDTDLAWRARLAGLRVVFCPGAAVVHDYEFERTSQKWFYLERNRVWAVLSNYELRTLALLAPLLLGVELAVLVRAASGRWLLQKFAAWASLIKNLPKLLRWRQHVQSLRRVPDGCMVASFCGAVRTPLLDSQALRRANPWLERYRVAVLFFLGR
jgi:GT2 family glycosyltransferase